MHSQAPEVARAMCDDMALIASTHLIMSSRWNKQMGSEVCLCRISKVSPPILKVLLAFPADISPCPSVCLGACLPACLRKMFATVSILYQTLFCSGHLYWTYFTVIRTQSHSP